MTRKDFYTAIANRDFTEEVIEYAMDKLENINNETEKKTAENEPIIKAIKTALFNGEHLASDIAKFVNENYMTVSTPKIVALLKKLAEKGIVTISSIKIPKVGTRNYYEMTVSNDDEENEEYINQYKPHELAAMLN